MRAAAASAFSSSVSIQSDIIDRIPKGRDFTSVINSAPGTSANESRGGGTMVDGASASENRFIVDGLDTTSLRTGTSSSDVPVDFLEQVQVKSGGYNAEYRAATGGVVSAITKSGSNSLHGTVGNYYTDNKFRGAIRRSIRLDPAVTTNPPAQYIITPRDKSHSYDPIVDGGGPILKDEAWFYVGYNPRSTRTQRTGTFTQTVPDGGSQTRTFVSEPEDRFLRYTVTGQIAHNIRARFAGANERAKGGIGFPTLEPNGTTTGNPRTFIAPSATCTNLVCNPNTGLRSDFVDDQATGVVDWVLNSKTYVNVTTSRLFYGSHNAGAQLNDQLRHTFSASNIGLLDVPASLQQPNAYADSPVNSFAVKDNYGRVNVNADVTRYAHFKGEHAFKLGMQWERITNDVDTGGRAPTVALSWDASRTTNDATPRIVRGTYGYYLVNTIFTQGKIHAVNSGIFLQDAWTINRKLTLNYGVRTDSEDIPSYSPKDPGVHFGWSDKIAPRLGFAYDVKGDSTWKVYGTWGVFNDIMKLEMPRGSWGADHWILYYYTLDTPNWPGINCEGPPGSGCPGTFIEQVDNRHPSNDRNNPLIDPNLKPVRTQELTGGFDHELSRTMSFGIRYSHKWLDRTIEDVGITVPGVGEVFYIANPGFGIAQHILGDQYPTTPKAKRVYDGVEFRLRKRLANRWSTDTSFLLSRLYGNYSGLASTDENGRTSPNVDRLFDGLYMSFDETGQPLYGRLATDRPFTFKTQTTYDLPWGTSVGAFFYAASGQPLSSQVTIVGVPVFYKGRGDLGRLPTFTQTDINLQHGFKLPGHTRVELEANVINLFDQAIATQISNTPYRDAIPVTASTGFFNGVNVDAIAAATPTIRKDPRYKQFSGFQGERTMRFMMKFTF